MAREVADELGRNAWPPLLLSQRAEYIPPRELPTTPQRIPRVIRQTHKGRFSQLPQKFAEASRLWRALNPEYAYAYYGDDAMRSYVAAQARRPTHGPVHIPCRHTNSSLYINTSVLRPLIGAPRGAF